MKILVLSDSHASLSFMRLCIAKLKPDQVIHLGDHYDDGAVLAEENPYVRFHQVPGNCDRFRCPPGLPEILCYDIGGVRFYMTHGHKHNVKFDIGRLLSDARSAGAQAVLYGHTHQAQCVCTEEGTWVLNPGSCGCYGGSVGVINVEDKRITACHILRQAELDMLK